MSLWHPSQPSDMELPPLLRLPTEILVVILDLSVHRSVITYLRDLLNLSLVCRRLHDIIASTPSFHSYIDTRFAYGPLKRTIEFSGSTPLSVVISAVHDQDSKLKLDALVSTVPRWRSASIEAPYGFFPTRDILQKMMRQPALILRTLTVSNLDTPKLAPSLFDGNLPELQSMEVYWCRLHWESIKAPKLHELELRRPIGLTTFMLLSLLTECPQLRNLTVSGLKDCPEDSLHFGSSGSQCDVVHFPYLSSLSMLEVPGTIASRIFPRISAPSLRHLVAWISGVVPEHHLSTVKCLLRSLRSTRTEHAWRDRHLDLAVGTNDIRIWTDPPDDSQKRTPLLIRTHGTPTSLVFPPLFQIVDEIFPDATLRFQFDARFRLASNGDPVVETLWRLGSNVTVVSIHGGQDDRAVSVMNMLRTPRRCDRGTLQWVFPRLTVLKISGGQSGGSVLKMVEGRYGHGLAEDAAVELPARLQVLEMPSVKRDGYHERIVAIVGGDVAQDRVD